MNEDATEIFVVFFHAMIQLFDMVLIQEPQHFFLELTAALAWDNFNKIDLSVNCFFHDLVEFFVDQIAFVVNIMQIQF